MNFLYFYLLGNYRRNELYNGYINVIKCLIDLGIGILEVVCCIVNK